MCDSETLRFESRCQTVRLERSANSSTGPNPDPGQRGTQGYGKGVLDVSDIIAKHDLKYVKTSSCFSSGLLEHDVCSSYPTPFLVGVPKTSRPFPNPL